MLIMWPFKKKTRQRRVEARKGARDAVVEMFRRFRDAGGVPAMMLATVFLAGAVAMDVWPVDPTPYRKGQYISHDITSRLDFTVPSQERIEKAKRRAREDTPAIFQLDRELVDKVLASAAGPTTMADTQPETAPADHGEQIQSLQAALKNAHIVGGDRKADQEKRRDANAPVRLISDGEAIRTRVENLIATDETDELNQAIERILDSIDGDQTAQAVKIALTDAFAKNRPIYRYDEAATDAAIAEALAAIDADPPSITYKAQDILVYRSRQGQGHGRGTAGGLSVTEVKLLGQEHNAYLAAERQHTPWRRWGRILGRCAVLVLVIVVACIHIAHYQSSIVRNWRKGFVLAAFALGTLAITKLMQTVLGPNPYAATLPVLMAAIIAAIAYDQRFALTLTTVITVMVVMQLRADFYTLLVMLSCASVGVFGLREIRTIGKLIGVSSVAAITAIATVWGVAFLQDIPFWPFVITDAMWAGVFAMLAGLLVQSLLPLIERFFGVVTSMTLRDWCDPSKPLMRRLQMETPGTYHHSLQLGSMCETAAEAIGARGLLARVGAHYHDIGKINKPGYFIENQAGQPTKHEKLSPAMSLLIIVGHVKDGLEMAREYGLPKILLPFIASHHGTTLVQYFYQAAAEQRKNGDDRAPDEVEFRYPGPKPQTKETAILMLADASESSVRAMSEPTPGRIENQVHTMVMRRLMDGQFDECELTLSEVHKIESSLIKSLCAIYHSRISYPEPEKGRQSPASDVKPKSNQPTEKPQAKG